MRSFGPVARRFCVIAGCLALQSCDKEVDPATSAKTFFQQVASGKLEQAYQSTAFGFQAGQSEKNFETTIRELGLLDGISVHQDAPKIEGKTATLHVDTTNTDGKKTAFVVTMTEETGAWRIFSIHAPKDVETGVVQNQFTSVGKAPELITVDRALPDAKNIERLVRDTLLAFDDAIAKRSFKEFYEGVSDKWKEQLTAGQLDRAFQPYIEHQYRISGVKDLHPIFDLPPAIDADGLMIVSGIYETKPFRTVFSMKFYYELPKWKLFGLDVNLRDPAGAPEAPAAK